MGSNVHYLDGHSLSADMLYDLREGDYQIDLTDEAWQAVDDARDVIDEILKSGKVTYGLNTGFGEFSKVVIDSTQLSQLQSNLIRSHAAGVGESISPELTRMLLALRINVLAKGHSGIRRETVKKAIDAFNSSCLPKIPQCGTVGASGDLAPLSHLALGLMGEGEMWDLSTSPPSFKSALEILTRHNLKPIELAAKEGLALINGTQFMTSLGVEACLRGEKMCLQADIIAAMSLEVLRGTNAALDAQIHAARKHKGQQDVACRMRALLSSEVDKSEIFMSHSDCGIVQDSYTLRCIPQVHGISHDTTAFVKNILNTEVNAGTDNPMVFSDRGILISGGNFHGEYVAKSVDYLAIGCHEIANMSERRIERMCNPSLSGLPAFLVKDGGLNSGFMIAHCTAAALVSENKGLCHPASVDSISTSAAKEDHVSMGGWAARKAMKAIENCEHVIAIELLAACQGMEFLRPLRSTKALEAVYDLVRSVVKPYDQDRFMAPDIEQAQRLISSGAVWDAAKRFLEYNSKAQAEMKEDPFHNADLYHKKAQ